MSDHSTATHSDRNQKRAELKAIVERLGVTATPAEIREEAYRVGLGVLNANMLMHVQNEIFPERDKQRGGYTREHRAVNDPNYRLENCPECGSPNVWIRKRDRWKTDNKMTVYRKCNDCGYRFQKIEESSGPYRSREANRARAALLTEKTCTKCERTLPIEKFQLVSGSPVLRRSRCKECLNQYRADLALKQLLDQFGLTPDEYNAMLSEQGGACAVCKSPGVGVHGSRIKPLVLDHCHSTGTVRGLLCNKCNLGIGNFDDDIVRLEAAVAYLKRAAEKGRG